MYELKAVKEVTGKGKVRFYKLSHDGVCEFDEFCAEVENNARDSKSLTRIFSTMDYMATYNTMLPKAKLNTIIVGGKVIGHEFKGDALRVYCMIVNPNVVILFGGYKKKQDKDVSKLAKIVKEIKGELSALLNQTT